MPRTTVLPVTISGSYIAAMKALTLIALDNVNGNQIKIGGGELLLIQNPTVGALTATIASSADALGRTKDIVEAIPAGAFRILNPIALVGWQQTTGHLWLNSATAGLMFAVIQTR